MTKVIKIISLTLVSSCTSSVKSCFSIKISNFRFFKNIELKNMNERLISDHVYNKFYIRLKRNVNKINIINNDNVVNKIMSKAIRKDIINRELH